MNAPHKGDTKPLMLGKIDFKKLIGVWAVLALAVAQIAVVQHNAVHPDHGFEVFTSLQVVDVHGDHQHDHDQDEKASKHHCPECLLVKTLQTAFFSNSTAAPITIEGQGPFFATEAPMLSKASSRAYNSRASPVLLI